MERQEASKKRPLVRRPFYHICADEFTQGVIFGAFFVIALMFANYIGTMFI